jgi:hypothetical protein
MFVKADFRVLDIPNNIPQVNQNFLEKNWKELIADLDNQIYCLLISSAYKGDANEHVCFLLEQFEEFLKQNSERSVVGLSLISHCCRFPHWDYLKLSIFGVHTLNLVDINGNGNENLKVVFEKSCKILSDDRVCRLIAQITDLKAFLVKSIVLERKFQLHFVDFDIPIKGWVTPVGVAINIAMLTSLEKTNTIAFSRILGHELTHLMNRISSNDFSVSTPQKMNNNRSPGLKKMLSEMKVRYPNIENHLESGLIFELGFVGEKFLYQGLSAEFLCKELEASFLNPDQKLPLYDASKRMIFCPTLQLNEQFGLYPVQKPSFHNFVN